MSDIDVRRIIADIRGIDVSTAAGDATFQDLGLSSLDMVAVLVQIEDILGFSIPYEDLASVDSLGGLEWHMSRLVRRGGGEPESERKDINL